MNRQEFFGRLGFYLQVLPPQEKSRTISYYDEIINDYMEEGISEAQAVAKLGDPQAIADTILSEAPAEVSAPYRISYPPTGEKKGISIGLVIVLICCLPILLPLAAVAFSLILVACILIFIPVFILLTLGISFVFGGLFAVVGSGVLLFQSVPAGIFQLGMSLVLIGCGIFCIIGFTFAIKLYIKAVAAIFRMIPRVFRLERASNG